MKTFLHNGWLRFCARMLSVLGIGSFTTSCVMYGPIVAAEYGCPYVRIEVGGTVRNSSGPVEGAKVSRYYEGTTTDKDGKFTLESGSHPSFATDTVHINVYPKEGSMEPYVVYPVEIVQVEPGTGWYNGKFVNKNEVEVFLNDLPAPEYGCPPVEYSGKDKASEKK